MGFGVDISAAVRRLNKNVNLQQTVFEAISNSLEANADKIVVSFFLEEDLAKENKIVGFSIEDNGEGFNKENRESFCTYMSEYKVKLGCKGVGRVTWLAVFERVKIESITDNEIVNINFDANFDKSNSIRIKSNEEKKTKKTTITFENIVDSKKQLIDLKEHKVFKEFYEDIRNHILIKLLLLKKANKKFIIELQAKNCRDQISDSNIPELKKKIFDIKGNDKESYQFYLYYFFINDGQNKKYLFTARITGAYAHLKSQ